MALLTDNLVSYWKLDDNSNDSVGSNNGTDTAISYASAGIIWNWATKTGATARIELATTTFNNYTAGTVSCWVKRTATGVQHMIFQKTRTAVSDYIYIAIQTSNYITWCINDTNFNCSTTQLTNTSTWYHIVMTWDWTNVIIYLNWNVEKSTVSNKAVANTSWTCSLMNNSWYAGSVLTWTLDEFWIRSRALNTTEIASLYNSWNWLQYPFTVTTNTANFLMFF